MSYWWRPGPGAHDVARLESAGLLPRFDDQQRAEDWLAACFGELRDHGVTAVSLLEEDRLVYGPMSLGD